MYMPGSRPLMVHCYDGHITDLRNPLQGWHDGLINVIVIINDLVIDSAELLIFPYLHREFLCEISTVWVLMN